METYGFNIIPTECTTGPDPRQSNRGPPEWIEAPVVYFSVSQEGSSNDLFREKVYQEYENQPIMIEDYEHKEFEISVEYIWNGSPRRDFTVKVYSHDGNDVEDHRGHTNQLHTDGRYPSEFSFVEGEFSQGRDPSEDETEVESDFSDQVLQGHSECVDTAFGALDSFEDSCSWYTDHRNCGNFDDSDFEANGMCCACGGGCQDTDEGNQDSIGFGCDYYNQLPMECGDHDNTSFDADEMCCACQEPRIQLANRLRGGSVDEPITWSDRESRDADELWQMYFHGHEATVEHGTELSR